MGFYATLLILHPQVERARKIPTLEDLQNQREMPSKNYTIWRGEEVIAFGRVTRIEKGEKYDGKTLAGICIASYLFEKLAAQSKDATKDAFAPPFAISEEKTETNLAWVMGQLPFEALEGGEEFLQPLDNLNFHLKVPGYETMLGHNHTLELPELEFLMFVRGKYHIVADNLMMWASCAEAAEWLTEMESDNSRAWKEMKDDEASLCYKRMWQSVLSEMGKTGARVVFVFDRSVDLSFL